MLGEVIKKFTKNRGQEVLGEASKSLARKTNISIYQCKNKYCVVMLIDKNPETGEVFGVSYAIQDPEGNLIPDLSFSDPQSALGKLEKIVAKMEKGPKSGFGMR